MKPRAGREIPESAFDLTSMIDVVFLLIVFFMMSAQFAATMASSVNLPEEKGDEAATASEAAVVIDITRAGAYVIGGREVALDELVQLVAADKRKLGEASELEVVVRADRDGSARHVNALAKALMGIGVRTWKLSTAGAPAPKREGSR